MREGWKKKTIGEIATVQYGYTGKAKNEGAFRYVRITDIDNEGKLILSKKKYLEFSEKAKEFTIEDNDLLMARTGASFAKLLLYEDFEPSVFASYLIKIKFSENILNKLYWYFSKSESYWNQAIALSSGAAQPHFNGAALKKLVFPYPKSLSEQKQIVAILDEAFEVIDQAIANIEKNIANAKELFQSKLNEVFSQKGDGWEEREMSEIGEIQTGTTPPTKDKSNYGDYIPFVKPPHFNQDGSIDTGESMLSKKGLEKGRLFSENSILMVCIGATIGKTGFSKSSVSSNQQINGLTPNENYIPKLLYFALISPYVQNQVMSAGKRAQATLPIINKTKWSKLLVNLPKDKKEQSKIVYILEDLNRLCIDIETIYSQKLVSLDELKKSILEKAFAGELTSSDIGAVTTEA